MLIKIIKTPDGGEPEWVRKGWVGVTLEAIPSNLLFAERNIVTGERMPYRKGVDVLMSHALAKIGRNEREWYLSNLRDIDGYFVFGLDEIKLIN